MGIMERFIKSQRQLVPGKLYTFDDLTSQEKADAVMSLEGSANEARTDYGIETPAPDLFQFRLHLISPDGIDANYIDQDTDPESQEFVEFMESMKNGLENIPVGWEGRHRALAFKTMGMPMYWFEIVHPEADSDIYNPMQGE